MQILETENFDTKTKRVATYNRPLIDNRVLFQLQSFFLSILFSMIAINRHFSSKFIKIFKSSFSLFIIVYSLIILINCSNCLRMSKTSKLYKLKRSKIQKFMINSKKVNPWTNWRIDWMTKLSRMYLLNWNNLAFYILFDFLNSSIISTSF